MPSWKICLPAATSWSLSSPSARPLGACLTAQRLALLPPGALVVNGARGALVDEPALISALAEGRVAAAALDVFAVEPLPADSPLRQLPGVLLSPHMAGSTAQASMRIVGQSNANLQRVLDGRPVLDVVNGVDAQVRRRS